MGEYFDTAKVQETCVLVGLITSTQDKDQLNEYLDELEFLALTAEAKCLKRFTQALPHPDSKTFVGSGKLKEIEEYVAAVEADCVIFDDELSPSQIRNIEKAFNPDEFAEHKVKILDRNNLILDIFAQRARTSHARTQVELAQYQYLLPRLSRMWTHLSKQKGGIGMKGPGEKEIETDRRIIRDRIILLKKQLETIDKQKTTQRGNRGSMIRVAVVGYTNVGKSTLTTALSKSEIFAENKLFATLDTTVRKVVIGNLPFLMSDTVGFIRKLPHQLIESFKSTLDETREADLLIHVVDISHPNFEDQYNVVVATLADIGSADKPTITVFNKVDSVPAPVVDNSGLEGFENPPTLEELKATWMAKINDDVVFISVIKNINMDELRTTLYEKVKVLHQKRYPYNNFFY